MARLLLLLSLAVSWARNSKMDPRIQLSAQSQQELEIASSNLLLAKGRQNKHFKESTLTRSTYPNSPKNEIDLLSEYGYHWCPDWTGEGWCPEGYLCGDGNNGCGWNMCCNDDPYIISCPSPPPNSNEVETPCSGNSLPEDAGIFDYYCCSVDEICGDGTACTQNCPRGECCPFNADEVDDACFPDPEQFVDPETNCPENISDECCRRHWDFLGRNPAVDMAWADFWVCNVPCFEFDNLDVNLETRTLVTHCNYCLGMFEYVCHREQGAICSMMFQWEMFLEVFLTDPDTGEEVDHSGDYTITQIDYDCMAEECDTEENEDVLESLLLGDVLTKINSTLYQNLRPEFQCSQIPHIGNFKSVTFDTEEDCVDLCPCDCAGEGGSCNSCCTDCEVCPECPECPTSENCPECPTSENCPECTECTECTECPKCPTVDECEIPKEVPYEEDYETEEKVIGTIIIQRTMAEYDNNKNTIAQLLIKDFENALQITQRINILSVVEGSIIATFEILPPDLETSPSASEVYVLIEQQVRTFAWQDDRQYALLSKAADVGCVSACQPAQEHKVDDSRLAAIIVIPIIVVMVILAIIVYCCLKNRAPKAEPTPSLLDDTDDDRGRVRGDIAMAEQDKGF